jgi:hypothetical protein
MNIHFCEIICKETRQAIAHGQSTVKLLFKIFVIYHLILISLSNSSNEIPSFNFLPVNVSFDHRNLQCNFKSVSLSHSYELLSKKRQVVLIWVSYLWHECTQCEFILLIFNL